MGKERIPVAVRAAVWNNYVGSKKGETKCFVGCGRTISTFNFQCGHVQAEAKGGKVTIDNLRPICSTCNQSMGTTNMEEFIRRHGYVKHKNWDKHFLERKERKLNLYFITIVRNK